mmetsp:Transcript_14007/g.19479  ORF Transcript_14007/g.19479 Transcript_14007/m.19479 type:complete len:625 (-) Transcript_14007:106-1980(-)
MVVEDVLNVLSFGHSKHRKENTIGMFGNGLKSSSMALGPDLLVLTKTKNHTTGSIDAAVGMLSQSYLTRRGFKEIRIPHLAFDPANPNLSDPCLQHILQFSILPKIKNLKRELNKIKGTGTRLIIYDLEKKFLSSQFKVTNEDLQLPHPTPNVPRIDGKPLAEATSLRKYLEILYSEPAFKITLQGKRIHPRSVRGDLRFPAECTYKLKQSGSKEDVEIAIGFHDLYRGMIVYHNGRLIKLCEPVRKYNQAQYARMVAVVNTKLKPIHNKQEFDPEQFRLLTNRVKKNFQDYFEQAGLNQLDGSYASFYAKLAKEPLHHWYFCLECRKWRKSKTKNSPSQCERCDPERDDFEHQCIEKAGMQVQDWYEIRKDSDYKAIDTSPSKKRKANADEVDSNSQSLRGSLEIPVPNTAQSTIKLTEHDFKKPKDLMAEYFKKNPEVEELHKLFQSLQNFENDIQPIIQTRAKEWKRNSKEQKKFRKQLSEDFPNGCIVTTWSCPQTYEAAHIQPVSKTKITYDVMNGMLLRRDFHHMFDKFKWTIDVGRKNSPKILYDLSLEDAAHDRILDEFRNSAWWSNISNRVTNEEQFRNNLKVHCSEFRKKHSTFGTIKLKKDPMAVVNADPAIL